MKGIITSIEVETLFVNPKTGRLVPAFPAVYEILRGMSLREFGWVAERIREARPTFDLSPERLQELAQRKGVKQEFDQEVVEFVTVYPSKDVEVIGQQIAGLYGLAAYASMRIGAFPVFAACCVANYKKLHRSPGKRYKDLRDSDPALFGDVEVDECGLHIHLEEEGDRMPLVYGLTPFIPPLHAMCGNSPIHRGLRTHHASWRSVMLKKFHFSDFVPGGWTEQDFDEFMEYLVREKHIRDKHSAYYRIKPHEKYPTIECKAFDTPALLSDALAITALFQKIAVRVKRLMEEGAWETNVWNMFSPLYPQKEAQQNFSINWDSAIRWGLGGRMRDFTMSGSPPILTRDLAKKVLDFAWAGEAHGAAYRRIVELIEGQRNTGADKQLSIFAELGTVDSVAQFPILQSGFDIIPKQDLRSFLRQARVSGRKIDDLMKFL
jgi:gamma-glutamyl:cysteine ligase YbdK (ATP-grasp superfamily)